MMQRLHQAARFVARLAAARVFALNIERAVPDPPHGATVPAYAQSATSSEYGTDNFPGLDSGLLQRGYDTNSGSAILHELDSRQSRTCPYTNYGYCEDSGKCCPLTWQCVSSAYSCAQPIVCPLCLNSTIISSHRSMVLN